MHTQTSTPKIFKNWTDNEIESQLKSKSLKERQLTLEIIELLEEVDQRKIYLARGFSSLIEYCVKELKYSESSAYRRISAMRIVREVPETKSAIEAGSLNLVTVSQAQTFFRAETKNKKPYSVVAKKALLEKLKNKSAREAEKVLLEIAPHHMPNEKIRQISPEVSQVTLVVSADLMNKLEQIKNLLSHALPDGQIATLIEHMADLTLNKINPMRAREKKSVNIRNATPPSVAHAGKNINKNLDQRSRYISQHIKKLVWQNSKSQCSYVDQQSGRRCESKKFLEIDHIQPFSRGGDHSPENLQLLCDGHNRWKGFC